jgi:hypothetical protein
VFRGTSLPSRIWTSGVCSCARAAAWAAWSARSQSAGAASAGRIARAGSVLMNKPIIPSTPASSAGRPDTVVPKTISVRPVSRASTSAQAP